MKIDLLKPREVDLLFRYPAGRSLRLAKAGLLSYISLPDGEIRFSEVEIQRLLKPPATTPLMEQALQHLAKENQFLVAGTKDG